MTTNIVLVTKCCSHLIGGTLPRVLATVARLGLLLQRQPVPRVAVQPLDPLVHQLLLYVLELVDVVRVMFRLLYALSALLVSTHRSDSYRSLGLVDDWLHLCQLFELKSSWLRLMVIWVFVGGFSRFLSFVDRDELKCVIIYIFGVLI